MPSFFPANVPLVNYFFYNSTLTAQGPNLPLAGGFVYFREDSDHTVPKPTYSDVTNPDDPVVNPNPLPLNDVGAWPLFYAEDGLYYIVITGPDADFDNPVWTLEHVNFSGSAGSTSENVINYIPNGQFSLHNDLPATDTLAVGEIRAPITNIAYGGWTFERPADSTATDIVTFQRYDEYVANPTGNPRYAVRVQCTEADSGDAFKDVRVKFPNVNRFASTTQDYTFSLSGMDNLAGSFPVDLYLIKNFGTDGDPETETLLTTFNLTPSESDFFFVFIFGSNEGAVIGPSNDDYIQLAIRLRTNETSDILLTDFDLQSGNLSAPVYPETTQRQDVSASLGGAFPIPDPLGFDLYLTSRLTSTGWTYDRSEIGNAELETQTSVYDGTTGLHPTTNKMLGMGAKYITSGYSPLGVPFKRLFDNYFDSTANVPRYGTGSDYLTCAFSGTGNQLIISNNSAGSVNDAANGTPSPTFTIATIHQGDTGYFCKSYLTATDTLWIQNNNAGAVTQIGNGTSGFNIQTIQTGSSVLPQISALNINVSTATGLASEYFTFHTYNSGDQSYYCWFKVDLVGTDPTPGGTGIEVNLLSTDTATIIAQKIQTALNGWEVTTILTVAASAIPAGSYFTISATGGNYFVWYKKNGAGTKPSPGGTGIEVDISSTDTDTQIATKTQIAMNSYSFASPDVRGQFPRFSNSGATIDQGVRWSLVPGIIGNDTLGTFELSANLEHSHSIFSPISNAGNGGTDVAVIQPVMVNTGPSGGTESRPINANFTLAIRY